MEFSRLKVFMCPFAILHSPHDRKYLSQMWFIILGADILENTGLAPPPDLCSVVSLEKCSSKMWLITNKCFYFFNHIFPSTFALTFDIKVDVGKFSVKIKSPKFPFVFWCPCHMWTLFLLFFLVKITPFKSDSPELCAFADLLVFFSPSCLWLLIHGGFGII